MIFFSIKVRNRTYWTYFCTVLITGFSATILVIAFIVIPAISSKQYEMCSPSSEEEAWCGDRQSRAILKAMLGLGVGTVLANSIYIFVFQFRLMGGCEPILHFNSSPSTI